MDRHMIAVLATGAGLSLAACGGNGNDQGMMDAPEPRIPASHTTHIPATIGPAVLGVYDEDGELTGIAVRETEVGLDQQISSVSGREDRERVGLVLQNEEVIVRHVTHHWNRQSDAVAEFEYMSYGAWARGTTERLQGGEPGYDYESIGGAYLTALDDARTPSADMPASGTATYLGQFTGFLHGRGTDGSVRHVTGDLELTADFANTALTLEMVSTRGNRAVLRGAIQGNEFSGTTIDHLDETSALQAQGATAEFEGGFYGGDAEEAGGVLQIVGGHAQNPGRLISAFGGRKDE